jgi:hypothetical protein
MNPPKTHLPCVKPKTAQPKMADHAASRKPPVASAVYKPNPVPRVLQTKTLSTLAPKVSHLPVAPPVTLQAVQPKTIPPPRSIPPVQMKTNVVQRARDDNPNTHTASATNGHLRRTDSSGGGGYMKHRLFQEHRRSDARRFWAMLEAVDNQRGGNQWHAFDCAEAKVVGALLLAGANLRDIVITQIRSGQQVRNPCRNCRQWLTYEARYGGYVVNIGERAAPPAGAPPAVAPVAAAPVAAAPAAAAPAPAAVGGGGGGGAPAPPPGGNAWQARNILDVMKAGGS